MRFLESNSRVPQLQPWPLRETGTKQVLAHTDGMSTHEKVPFGKITNADSKCIVKPLTKD